MKNTGVILCIMAVCVLAIPVSGFNFTQDPIQLVEPDYESFSQTGIHATFDFEGNLNTVFECPRTGNTQVFGRSIMPGGAITDSYRAYYGDTTADPRMLPFVMPTTYGGFNNKSYILSINTAGTTLGVNFGSIDTMTLPAVPATANIEEFSSSVTSLNKMDVIGGNGYLLYVYDDPSYSPSRLVLNKCDELAGSWQTEQYYTSSLDLSHPSIAMDGDGYIYMAYQEGFGGNNNLYVVRSYDPCYSWDLNSWTSAHIVESNSIGHDFRPAIAVSGSYGSDLKVAVSYVIDTGSLESIALRMDYDTDWSSAAPSFNAPMNASSAFSSGTVNFLAADIEYGADGKLYVAWADERDAVFKLFGNVSDDGGFTINTGNEVNLGGVSGVYGSPVVATGYHPGDVAVAFIRDTGTSINPYVLVSQSTFFDSCDLAPSSTGYWTNSAGVSVYSGTAPAPYSDPSCYMFANADKKGSLLSDFGTQEVRGTVSFQFYDTLSMTLDNDFYIALENNNSKGVIRMLGVRNDTSSSTNYRYSENGIDWLDTGIARTIGWHEFSMIVSDTGLIMNIDGALAYGPDSGFTSFTSIEMEGGQDGDEYFVDDIRVETYNLVEPPEPQPLPAISTLFLMILLLVMGVAILRGQGRV